MNIILGIWKKNVYLNFNNVLEVGNFPEIIVIETTENWLQLMVKLIISKTCDKRFEFWNEEMV